MGTTPILALVTTNANAVCERTLTINEGPWHMELLSWNSVAEICQPSLV